MSKTIEVQVRLRPVENGAWSASDTVLYSPIRPDMRFQFHNVHNQAASNAQIFHHIEPLVQTALDGRNVTVMAYGQTGSGKTHSMVGTSADEGFIPRAAQYLIAHLPAGCELAASVIEIYNETVRDLLNTERGDLPVREGVDNAAGIVDRSSIPIHSQSDFVILSSRAENSRKYGVTDLNEHSSRSHTIMCFDITRPNGAKNTLHFVDLAGSESAAKANTGGQMLREGNFINRSLLALGNVVDAIVDERPHVPFRESKLTRILRPCLGGFNVTFILCCVNPAATNFDQTVTALRFAQRARKIRTDPVTILQTAPLVAFRLAKDTEKFLQNAEEAAAIQYQRGLASGYQHCIASAASHLESVDQEVAGTLEEVRQLSLAFMANEQQNLMQRQLDAQEEVHAQLGLDPNDEDRAVLGEQNTNSAISILAAKRKEKRELVDQYETELMQLREKRRRMESEIETRRVEQRDQAAAEQHRLDTLRAALTSVFVEIDAAERADRQDLEQQWATDFTETVSNLVGAIANSSSLSGSDHAAALGGPEAAMQLYKPQLQRLQAEVKDLQAAWDMVRGELKNDAAASLAAAASASRGHGTNGENLSIESKIFDMELEERTIDEAIRLEARDRSSQSRQRQGSMSLSRGHSLSNSTAGRSLPHQQGGGMHPPPMGITMSSMSSRPPLTTRPISSRTASNARAVSIISPGPARKATVSPVPIIGGGNGVSSRTHSQEHAFQRTAGAGANAGGFRSRAGSDSDNAIVSISPVPGSPSRPGSRPQSRMQSTSGVAGCLTPPPKSLARSRRGSADVEVSQAGNVSMPASPGPTSKALRSIQSRYLSHLQPSSVNIHNQSAPNSMHNASSSSASGAGAGAGGHGAHHNTSTGSMGGAKMTAAATLQHRPMGYGMGYAGLASPKTSASLTPKATAARTPTTVYTPTSGQRFARAKTAFAGKPTEAQGFHDENVHRDVFSQSPSAKKRAIGAGAVSSASTAAAAKNNQPRHQFGRSLTKRSTPTSSVPGSATRRGVVTSSAKKQPYEAEAVGIAARRRMAAEASVERPLFDETPKKVVTRTQRGLPRSLA